MSGLKMKTFDVHNNSPIVSRDSYSGSYRDFQMSYECMVEIRQLENILKSEVLLVNSISRREKKLAKQLEIQTKRVENLKKSNEFYSSGDAHDSNDSWVEYYENGHIRFATGKLARSCQAIDQELENEIHKT